MSLSKTSVTYFLELLEYMNPPPVLALDSGDKITFDLGIFAETNAFSYLPSILFNFWSSWFSGSVYSCYSYYFKKPSFYYNNADSDWKLSDWTDK